MTENAEYFLIALQLFSENKQLKAEIEKLKEENSKLKAELKKPERMTAEESMAYWGIFG